jgi:hypothetical protein
VRRNAGADLAAKLTAHHEGLTRSAHEVVETVVDGARDDMKARILAAHTATGRARAASEKGGEAGRYETGEMYDGVEARTEQTATGAVGEFGWFDPEGHELAQDWGAEGTSIPPAHSLFEAFVAARENLASEIQTMKVTT